MSDSSVLIANLLYRYAELMDAGDLETVAAMFAHARIHTGSDGVVQGSEAMLDIWRRYVRLHADGTPRTKHIITNPIIEIDEAAGVARCRSYFTVIQAAPGQHLQPICAGRYHDTFVREDGQWRFAERDYSMLDLIGDLSQHMLVQVAVDD